MESQKGDGQVEDGREGGRRDERTLAERLGGCRGQLTRDSLALGSGHREFPGALRGHAHRGGNAAPVPGTGGRTAHAPGQHRRLEDHQPLPEWSRYVGAQPSPPGDPSPVSWAARVGMGARGKHKAQERALEWSRQMVHEGAAID